MSGSCSINEFEIIGPISPIPAKPRIIVESSLIGIGDSSIIIPDFFPFEQIYSLRTINTTLLMFKIFNFDEQFFN